jgi:hypothetical protein
LNRPRCLAAAEDNGDGIMAIRLGAPALAAKTVAIVAAFLILLAPIGFAPAAAAAGIFQQMTGTWRGNGSIKWYDGQNESLRCTATNEVKDDGNKLNQVLKCASRDNNLNIITDLSYRSAAGVVVGNWRETNFKWGGHISGTANARRINARVSMTDGNVSVRISVVTNGGQQTVTLSITSPEGLTEISAQMRKG